MYNIYAAGGCREVERTAADFSCLGGMAALDLEERPSGLFIPKGGTIRPTGR